MPSNGPDMLSEEDKKCNLWRCDCSDEGVHIDPDQHESTCSYVDWLEDHKL